MQKVKNQANRVRWSLTKCGHFDLLEEPCDCWLKACPSYPSWDGVIKSQIFPENGQMLQCDLSF